RGFELARQAHAGDVSREHDEVRGDLVEVADERAADARRIRELAVAAGEAQVDPAAQPLADEVAPAQPARVGGEVDVAHVDDADGHDQAPSAAAAGETADADASADAGASADAAAAVDDAAAV